MLRYFVHLFESMTKAFGSYITDESNINQAEAPFSMGKWVQWTRAQELDGLKRYPLTIFCWWIFNVKSFIGAYLSMVHFCTRAQTMPDNLNFIGSRNHTFLLTIVDIGIATYSEYTNILIVYANKNCFPSQSSECDALTSPRNESTA